MNITKEKIQELLEQLIEEPAPERRRRGTVSFRCTDLYTGKSTLGTLAEMDGFDFVAASLQNGLTDAVSVMREQGLTGRVRFAIKCRWLIEVLHDGWNQLEVGVEPKFEGYIRGNDE